MPKDIYAFIYDPPSNTILILAYLSVMMSVVIATKGQYHNHRFIILSHLKLVKARFLQMFADIVDSAKISVGLESQKFKNAAPAWDQIMSLPFHSKTE